MTDGICGHKFDASVCVAHAGHGGAHVTSSDRFPHGLLLPTTTLPGSALRTYLDGRTAGWWQGFVVGLLVGIFIAMYVIAMYGHMFRAAP